MTEDASSHSGALALRPSLADPAAAAKLFACAASDFLHAIYRPQSNASEEEISTIVFGMAALFEDASGIVDLPKGFSTASAAKRLRPYVEKRINTMSPEDRSLFEDDAGVVALAVNMFFEELLVRADAWLELRGAEMDEAEMHEFLASDATHLWMINWAERILGVKAR